MEDHDRSGAYPYGGNSYGNSSSSNNTDMQLQTYHGGPHELRCHSASYAQARMNGNVRGDDKGRHFKPKKGKGASGSASNSWGIVADPEFQRKRRVASYKMYGVEGKVKGSFRKSFRWLKDRYSRVVNGRW